MKKSVKIIFHIDLNAFFASCHIIREPYLNDKVFVVGGSAQSGRGVVSTASYKARAYGITSAMSVPEAMALFPRLLVVPTDFRLYRTYSERFFELLGSYSDKILQGSIDEAYIDMTEASETTHPLALAREIQNRLKVEHGLPSSIGIAPTLFLAKMASDMKKPMGITVMRKKDIVKTLFPLPIKDMYGIGKKTWPRLMDKGIMTIGDFMHPGNREKVTGLIGEENYAHYVRHVKGKSSDIVDPDAWKIPKSVSSETTLNYPIEAKDAVFEVIRDQFEDTYRRLLKDELVTKTVGIKTRNARFENKTRSVTLDGHTDDKAVLLDAVETVFDTTFSDEPVRLAGVFFNQVMLKKDLKTDINLFNYQTFSRREAGFYGDTKETDD